MTLGNRIKRAREDLGWDVARLAKESGVPYSTIKGIENGHQATSTATPKLADAMGVPALWLAEGKGPRSYQAERNDGVSAEVGRESQNAKLDEVMLDAAEAWVRFEEGAGRTFQPVRRLERKMEIARMMQDNGGSLSPQHAQEIIEAAREHTRGTSNDRAARRKGP